MIKYGLSKHQLKESKRFGDIFNKDQDEFVLGCILTILCEWNEDKEQFNSGRGFDPDMSELDFSIDLPIDAENDLYELSDYHDLSIHDCINGIVGMVLLYLDLNWSGEYGLESEDMNDPEKLEQLTRENKKDDYCWVKFFG